MLLTPLGYLIFLFYKKKTEQNKTTLHAYPVPIRGTVPTRPPGRTKTGSVSSFLVIRVV